MPSESVLLGAGSAAGISPDSGPSDLTVSPDPTPDPGPAHAGISPLGLATDARAGHAGDREGGTDLDQRPDQGPDQEPWRYEVAVAEVEAIVAQIEGGELELAELFDRFEAAVTQLRQCEAFLNEKQQQVDLLIETLEEF
ncbi:MAG: exodeoxyribonuclease VII small subunit [Prochlorothrix sp.]|nr:exodeoxyribonuclease VII small subunit [Prochlorothrix sp.]